MTRRTPDKYNWKDCLFDETHLPASPRRITKPRRDKVFGITIHHMAMVGRGDGSANDACLRAWKTREASAHYGVDGRHVRQFVWDNEEAWACANGAANRGTISIEHANSSASPSWRVSAETFVTGAKLVAALHIFHKLGRPVDGKVKNHVRVSGTMFKHSDWYSTACCGPYLGGEVWDEYVKEAQHQYDLLKSGAPTPVPDEEEDAVLKTVYIKDARIKEASGMVASERHPGHYWVCNDENGLIFLVRGSDAKIVGSFKLKGRTLYDPEWLAIRPGSKKLTVGDTGDGASSRKNVKIYTLAEPGIGHHGELGAVGITLTYSDKTRPDAEAGIYLNGVLHVITKASKGGLYKVQGTALVPVRKDLPSWVTDVTLSPSGKRIYVTRKKQQYFTAVDLKTWKALGNVPVHNVKQPETIELHSDKTHALVGSEGVNSPLVPVLIPDKYL